MIDTGAPAATTRTPRSVALLRRPPILRLASSCGASMVAGLVEGGLGARLAMRLSAIAADDSRIGMITENGNVVGVITTEGTLALLLFVGLVAGLSTGLILFVLRTVLPGRSLPLWVSLVLLGVASPLVIDPANADFTILGNRALNVAMFAALFPAFGFGSVWIAERFDLWLLQWPLVRLAPLTIVGHSLGGNIALRYTGLYPANVRKLVAIEGLGLSPRMLAERNAIPFQDRWRQWIDQKRAVSGRPPRRYSSVDEAQARMRAENTHLTDGQASDISPSTAPSRTRVGRSAGNSTTTCASGRRWICRRTR